MYKTIAQKNTDWPLSDPSVDSSENHNELVYWKIKVKTKLREYEVSFWLFELDYPEQHKVRAELLSQLDKPIAQTQGTEVSEYEEEYKHVDKCHKNLQQWHLMCMRREMMPLTNWGCPEIYLDQLPPIKIDLQKFASAKLPKFKLILKKKTGISKWFNIF